MKKIYFLILTFLITVTFVKAQDGWITHKGDDRISIKFPSEPTELTPGSFIALDNDSVAYIFTIVDFEKVANLDSVALAPIITTPEFAAQLKTGIKQSLPDVDFPDFTIGTWKGFTSYSSSGLDSKEKKYDMLMFIIGSKLYSVSTVSASSVNSKGFDNFVNSIMLSN
jgi:hypothetical protein